MASMIRIKEFVSPTARLRWRVVHELPFSWANGHIMEVYLQYFVESYPDKRYKMFIEHDRR